jgi:predicted metal-dependent hydrolase
MNSIKFGNQVLNYTLSRSNRRKTLSMSVNQSGLSIIAPSNTPIEIIESTIIKKAAWILKQFKDFDEMANRIHVRSFLSGEKLPYMGRQYRLKIEKLDIKKPVLRFYQGRFIAELPNDITDDQLRDTVYPLYVEWIKSRALEFTKVRIKKFILKLQVEPKTIAIRGQEQRWGSCTPKGEILLNWRIFLAPTSIIDYVLAHEMAHLKHMNHSREYWETLRMLLPDFEQRKEWLRLYGSTLDV